MYYNWFYIKINSNTSPRDKNIYLIPKLKFQDKYNLNKSVIKYQWYRRIMHSRITRKCEDVRRRGGIKMANSSKYGTRVEKPRRYHRIYYSKCVFSFHRLRVLYTATSSFIPVSFFLFFFCFQERNMRLKSKTIHDIGS